MLSFVSSDQVNLVDFHGARKVWGGGGLHHPLPKLPGQLLGIIFVDSQFMGDLAIAQIQPHQVQPGNPDPQWLVMARKHRSSQVVKLLLTCQTAISLSGTLTLVPALFGDLVHVAVRTPHPFWPAVGPDDLKTLVVV